MLEYRSSLNRLEAFKLIERDKRIYKVHLLDVSFLTIVA